jgi:hypothetical protein
LNVITSVPNFMKMYQAVQKLLVWDTQTDRQTFNLISLLSFLESRLSRTRVSPSDPPAEHSSNSSVICIQKFSYNFQTFPLTFEWLSYRKIIIIYFLKLMTKVWIQHKTSMNTRLVCQHLPNKRICRCDGNRTSALCRPTVNYTTGKG